MSSKRSLMLKTLSYLRTQTLMVTFVCVTFMFHFRNLFGLGPTWDDWYYPENFNKQLWSFDPDFDSFSTGYGLGGFTLVDALAKLVTGNFSFNSEDNFTALVARRVILLTLSYFGALATYGVVRNLGYSSGMAKIAALLLLTLPNWVGQASINIKDIPVAVGLIFLVDAFVRVLVLGNTRVSTRKRILVFIEVFVGFYLSFGTRFGLIAFILVATSILFLANKRVNKIRTGISNFSLAACMMLSYLMLLPLNPILINPIKFVPKAIFGTLNLYQQSAGPVLTNGAFIDGNNPPTWYLPTWTFAQLPLTHLCLLLIGIPAIAYHLRRFSIPRLNRNEITLPALTIFILMTLAPYVTAILLSPPLYDGDRQFLMAYPFFVLMMLSGINHLKNTKLKYREVNLTRFLVVALCLSPGVAVISSSPFTYSFRNEMIRFPENWEGDYMGVSLKKAAESTIKLDYQLAYDFSDERWLVRWNQENLGKTSVVESEQFLYIATRRGVRNSLPGECTEIQNIETRFLGRENNMSFVAICNVEKVGK